MAKKKKGKSKRAQKAHEEEEGYGDWDDNMRFGEWNRKCMRQDEYKTFEVWHREVMRTIAEETLYVRRFQEAFTLWDDADIRTFIRKEGLH